MATLVQGGFGGWTARVTPALTYPSVAWSPTLNLFAAVSDFGGSTTPVATSPTGVTWTARSGGTVDHIWTDAIWVPSLALFVAVADTSGTAQNVMTSPDGLTWSLRTAGDEGWRAVAGTSALLVAVGQGSLGDGAVMTSTDAVTWTTQSTTGMPAGGFYNIGYSETLAQFLAVRSPSVYSSVDGVAWTLRYTNPAAYGFRVPRPTWSSTLGLWVAFQTDPADIANTAALTSPDGVTWTSTPFTGGMSEFLPTAVEWCASIATFVLIDETTKFATSTNGTTWTVGTKATGDWQALAWAPALSLLAATGTNGTTADAMTASYSSAPSVTGLEHLEGEAVAVVGDGIVLASPYNPAYTVRTVTGGAITLPAGSYTTVLVGLPYVTDIETLDIDSGASSRKDAGHLVTRLGLWLEDSRPPFAAVALPAVATSITGMQQIPALDAEQNVTASTISGYIEGGLDGAWNSNGRIALRHVDPSPLTVLAVVVQGNFGRS